MTTELTESKKSLSLEHWMLVVTHIWPIPGIFDFKP